MRRSPFALVKLGRTLNELLHRRPRDHDATACQMIPQEVKALVNLADERLAAMFLQLQPCQPAVHDLHCATQFCVRSHEHENVVHVAAEKESVALQLKIELAEEERAEQQGERAAKGDADRVVPE